MEIFEQIRNILAEILDLEGLEITPESYLIRDLGAESIDLLELAASLNAGFGIEVNEDNIFMKDIRNSLKAEIIPFLTEQRIGEIAADLNDGPVVKVKDLVSYVSWQLKKAGHALPR
jgi:acyl carrier protein